MAVSKKMQISAHTVHMNTNQCISQEFALDMDQNGPSNSTMVKQLNVLATTVVTIPWQQNVSTARIILMHLKAFLIKIFSE